MVRRRKSAGGFTLIEILIALGIAMVGLLGMVSLQLIAIRGNSASRNFTEAVAIAQEKLESAEFAPVGTLPALAETGVSVGSWNTITNVYTRDTTVTTTLANNVSTTTIRVVVSWADPFSTAATTHKVTMWTERTQ